MLLVSLFAVFNLSSLHKRKPAKSPIGNDLKRVVKRLCLYGQVSDGPAAADGVYPGGLRGGGHPPQDRYTFLLVPYNNDKDRRKAKGRRYCLGAELVQFLAALAICTRMI